ncbi:MAG: hypothetical protein BLM47_09880 [Candidatus Reconcilbacillus cellulovorans]|uniref:Uncharacterized protein n=1 Tax=Candidatus Reconcilbacillus cellulovorans TaxID=1906605 RepID=A0A2A6DYV8_9BACL|nr:MAG: hypothetical protein BLM47_09880 [Candidatus Reconcilbacillus cellulovorans]
MKFPIIADPWMGIDLYSSVTITFQPAGFVVKCYTLDLGKVWVGVATWGFHVSEVKSKAGEMDK